MGKGCNTRWLLLLSLGTVLLMAGALVYSQSARPAARPSLTLGAGITARQALAPAAELAEQWQEDAQLAVVSTHRLAAGTQSQGESEWAFQFFSPSTQRLALVTVIGEEAHITRETLSPYSVPTFLVKEWHVDSDQALQVWWEKGGGTLLTQRPDADLAMQLRGAEDGGEHPVWMVTGFVVSAESAFIVTVDATSGTVVEQ